MKVVDANLLLYAMNEDAPAHRAARAWLEQALSGTETIGLPWNVLLAVLRLSTRAAVFPRPLSLEDAFLVIDSWLGQPCVMVPEPTARHAEVLKALLLPVGAGGNLTSDAHLAAIAIEHGAELCSCDADFGRFPGLRWVNPIAT